MRIIGTNIEFRIGENEDPIEDQLNRQGYSLGDMAGIIQKVTDCTSLLWKYHYLKNDEYFVMLERISKKISEEQKRQ